MTSKLEQALESGTIQFPRGLTGEERRAFIKEKLMEDKHYQNALSLYEMILDNVEELSHAAMKGKRNDEKYIDSARIGVLSAWCDSLCHMLNDVQIEALKQRMQIVVDKE